MKVSKLHWALWGTRGMAAGLCALVVIDAGISGPSRLPLVARSILWMGAAFYICSTVVLEVAIRSRSLRRCQRGRTWI
jgi:hypothetical protein